MSARSSNTRPIDASFHHGDHRQLLVDVPVVEAEPQPVDALIVPAARPVHWLRESMALAHELGCGVVAMCSYSVDAGEVAQLGDSLDVPVIAVNVAKCQPMLPALTTKRLLDQKKRFRHGADTGTKRNLGLVLARVAGWQRVLFLDDDIYAVDPSHARAAVGLLDQFDVVGMHNQGYPDNSVVCHAGRILGERQAEFIGAGAMAVNPTRTRSFFPDIYNEDWFFILGNGLPSNIAITGQMKQKRYAPFAVPDRARREELGDCLAEGLFWLLDHRLPFSHADIDHWRDFLSRRSYFIDVLIGRLRDLDVSHPNRQRMAASLATAQQTFAHINPSLCRDFIQRWMTDLDVWRSFIDVAPVGLGAGKALEHLDWSGVVVSDHSWPAAPVDPIRYSNGWIDELPASSSQNGASSRAALPPQLSQGPARRRIVR